MSDSRLRLQEVNFHNPRLSKVGVEVIKLDALLNKESDHLLSSPRRVNFHHVLLVQRGAPGHMVDFVEHQLCAGSVLFVRPGQVQQWRPRRGVDGHLALFSSEALGPSVGRLNARTLALTGWPVVSRPSQRVFTEALSCMRRLASDVQRFDGTELDVGVIRHELLVLLMRLAREIGTERPVLQCARQAETYKIFENEMETSYAKRWSVQEYCERLGLSESTLSRATMAVVGHTAKEAIDRRIALEAKRLLVHSQATVANIGYQLGFTEPTNFVKFFRRNAQCTPLQFRQGHAWR